MAEISEVVAWASLKACLALLTVCSLLKQSAAALETNATYPPYRVISLGEGFASSEMVANILPVSAQLAHAHFIEARPVDIRWLNSSTDTISIHWSLADTRHLAGYIRESVVEYIQEGGKYTTRPLDPSVNEYTFRNLEVDTLYTVCAYMIEIYGSSNESSITHSKCVKIRTIEYIRRDSVLVLMVILGYYMFVCALGYTQWKRKCWSIEKKNRAREAERCDLANTNADKYAMRWKDLEQRERLMAKPGCSIESNVT